jgi:hypothetical protein
MKKQRNNITDALDRQRAHWNTWGCLSKEKLGTLAPRKKIIAQKITQLPITAYVQCSFHSISSSGSWDGGLNQMIRNRLGILFWQELVQVVMCSLPG